MNPIRRFRIAVIVVPLTASMAFFTNCTDGFESSLVDDVSQAPINDGPNPVNPGNPGSQGLQPPPVPFSQLEQCHASVAAGTATDIATCLLNAGALPAGLTSAVIATCVASSGNLPQPIAICLSKRQILFDRYREVFQTDIDTCNGRWGLVRVHECLRSRGIDTTTFTQADISSCAAESETQNVERCLRRRGLLRRIPALFPVDVEFCRAVDGEARLAYCLKNKDLAYDNILQSTVENCLQASAGMAGLSACLRVARVTPRFLMQAHVDRCVALEGEARLVPCLQNLGFLGGIGFQGNREVFDNCLLTVGVSALVSCMINNGLLAVTHNRDYVVTCYLTAGPSGIAECLEKSGMLPFGVKQADFDACLAKNSEHRTLYDCMVNDGYIASFAALNAPQGLFTVHCTGCHSALNPAGSLVLTDYLSVSQRVIRGNPDLSEIIQRMESATAPMPPSGPLSNDEIFKVRQWILQGAVQN